MGSLCVGAIWNLHFHYSVYVAPQPLVSALQISSVSVLLKTLLYLLQKRSKK
jgi:hypothetical protein